MQDKSYETEPSNHIPVIVGLRPTRVLVPRTVPIRTSVKFCNEKSIQALSLPTNLSYNMRSIWSKIKNLANDLHERNADICFLCEVWEKSENPEHKAKLEELFEMHNIDYISTPRPGYKRGGGAAVAINTSKFSVTKLQISIPKPLEIVWAL